MEMKTMIIFFFSGCN